MNTHRTVSFRIDSEKVEQLDALAKSMDRDRSYLLNEAIDNYLAYIIPYIAKVEEGIAAADRGEFIEHEEVLRRIDTWTLQAQEKKRKTA